MGDFVIENGVLIQYTGNDEIVMIPDNVTSIGGRGSGWKIIGAFENCETITKVSIPDSVTSIGNNAFKNCRSLTSVTIPNSVTSIGKSAFDGCRSLTSVTIPNSVTNIGESVFSHCHSLTSVTIPNSVTSIAEYTFFDCGLMSVTIPNSVASIGNYAFSYCSFLTSMTIPDSVTNIGERAFEKCARLTNMKIPDGVTSIGKFAFSSCRSLTSVMIPDSVTSIGEFAFSSCSSLTSVMIPDSVKSIGKYAFAHCENLTSVTIPGSVKSIEEYAFAHCKNLTSVTIPDSVKSIEEYAFALCGNLKNMTIPDSVKRIMTGAFCGCNGLADASGLLIIHDVIHSCKKDMINVTIPDYVKGIGPEAFSDCNNLTSLTIPNGVTRIGEYAFSDCSSLTRVTIPNTVTSIGGFAFENCTNLIAIKVPTINRLGRQLSRLEKLKVIVTNEIEQPITDQFQMAEVMKQLLHLRKDKKTRIEAAMLTGRIIRSDLPDAMRFAEREGVLDIYAELHGMNADELRESQMSDIGLDEHGECRHMNDFIIENGLLKIYNGAGGKVVIPDEVTSIGKDAFRDCEKVTSVNIPDSVISIGESSFNGCKNLANVVMSNGLTFIGEAAFRECITLTSITIPDSVISIGMSAFMYCHSLSSITIPDSVTTIGHYAFHGCHGLADSSGLSIIRDVVCSYKRDITSVIIPSFVKAIDGSAFMYCHSLKSVTIPNSVTSIGEEAFMYCHNLTSVNIPDSVTSIGENAFMDCSSLTRITIPDSVASIGAEVFSHCDNLTIIKAPTIEMFDEHLGSLKKLKVIITNETITDENGLAEAMSQLKALRSDKKARVEAAVLIGKILRSDLPAAMRFAEKRGMLDLYAELRGMNADELRESQMSDLGLDEHGECRWTLDNRDIVVSLDADLVLTLTDTRTGKKITTIPKKNADPEAYAAASKALKDMKKSLDEMKKLWGTKLFSEFLSSYSRSAERWQKLFLHNPMMRGIGRLLVWQQGKQTFTLYADGMSYDAQGNVCVLTDEPVLLAHPMEMGSELTSAWQKHFMTEGLKQPFEQVWEPVIDKAFVQPGRYDGCTIELYHLMNKDKHGIVMQGQSQIALSGCTADLEFIEGHSEWVHNLFEVKNFTYKEYTRQVNHIVTLLDKGTVAGRIQKDDVTVAQWLDWFTPVQINGFIDLAMQNEAHNVTALLLDYKQQHYPDVDPMAEFTLDW